MGKAAVCGVCKTDAALQFKHYNREQWWVVCEQCGRHSTPGSTQTEAGENWNKENP